MANPQGNPSQSFRSGNGRHTRSPETAVRDARACELRAQGWSIQAIADEFGLHHSSVQAAIRRGMRDVIQGPAEQLLAVHMERLETLYEAAMEVMEADHVVVSHGKVITMTDEDGVERPLKDHGPKLAAIREARASLDSFWTLTGMKKPAKVEHSGGVKYELVGVDPQDLV
ncbi:helix-turn-helix domain-containing protein [Streptomyces sp. NPDC002920]